MSDSAIAFSNNLINRYIQFKMLKWQRELEERRERRYERQLQENRIYRGQQLELEREKSEELASYRKQSLDLQKQTLFATQESRDLNRAMDLAKFQESIRQFNLSQEGTQVRFEAGQALSREQMQTAQQRHEDVIGLSQKRFEESQRQFALREGRLERNAQSLIAERTKPQRGTKEYALSQGYSEKQAQLYQDRYNKFAPSIVTPYQRVTAGKMMMENATTTDMYKAGELIMQDAMKELQGQVAFPLEAELEPEPETEPVKYKEGQTAINPKTGERMMFKDGRWQSIQ